MSSQAKSILGPLNPSHGGGINGQYRAVGVTTAAAPTANSVLLSARFVGGVFPAPVFMVPLRIAVGITVVTAVTAQRTDPLALFVARSYSANESVNVASVTLTTNNAKARTTYPSSVLGANGQLAVATATAGISGGTKTLDATPFGTAVISGIGALGTGMPMTDIYRADVVHNTQPLVLANNEGFVVSWGGTTLATGTVTVSIEVDWAEVDRF